MATQTQTSRKNTRNGAPPPPPEPEPEVEQVETQAEEEVPADKTVSRQKVMHRIQGRIIGMLDRQFGDDFESKVQVIRATAALLGDSSMPTT